MEAQKLSVILLVVIINVMMVSANKAGPPAEACTNMDPQPGHGHSTASTDCDASTIQIGTCWPEIADPFDRLLYKIMALSISSLPIVELLQGYMIALDAIKQKINYDLLTEEGRHTFVCNLEEVDSAADLVQVLNIRGQKELQSFQQGYDALKMFYPLMGGKPSFFKIINGVDNFLAWTSQTGFPSIPFDGATEGEMYNAFMKVFNSIPPAVKEVAVAFQGDLESTIPMMARNIAHVFAVSKTMEEFGNNMNHPDAKEGLQNVIKMKPAIIPIIRELLAFVRVLLDEFDEYGMFRLPPE